MSIEDKQRLEQEAKENLKTNLENRNQAVPTAPGSEGNERPVSEHDADTGLSREVAQRIKSILFYFVVKMAKGLSGLQLPTRTGDKATVRRS